MSDPERDEHTQQPPEETTPEASGSEASALKGDETPVVISEESTQNDDVESALDSEQEAVGDRSERVVFYDAALSQAALEEQKSAPDTEQPDHDAEALRSDDTPFLGDSASKVRVYDTPLLTEAAPQPDDTAAAELDVADLEPQPEMDASATAFEALTLADALGQMMHSPLATLRQLIAVARTPDPTSVKLSATRRAYAAGGATQTVREGTREPAVVLPGLRRPHARLRQRNAAAEVPQIEDRLSVGRTGVQLALRVVAFLLAWWGTLTMVSAPSRSEADGLDVGMPLLVIGFFVWLVSEILGRGGEYVPPAEPAAAAPETTSPLTPRLIMLTASIALSGVGVALTAGNTFTVGGVFAWIASIVLGAWAVSPLSWSPKQTFEAARQFRLRINWVMIALVVITLVGGYFRLKDLNLLPREMTSDHVEMILDTYYLRNGAHNVFFSNNGGREAIQFYLYAFVSQLPGLGLDFSTLKLLNAIEGILAIPVMFFMGRAVIGDRERRLGTLVGLLTAAFVAVSYWDVILSRLGERIVLMPLATALLILFLVRALRYNRRGDFVWAGLALGVGLYTYQAFRMMPLVILVSGVMALAFYLRRREDARRLVINFAALGFVALLVYLPLFSYSLQYPEDYWRRTSGRLFGDEITQTTDENGNLIFRQPTIEERVAAFQQNFPQLVINLRNAALMYNWKGDVAWFQNYPNEPAFDPIAGGLLVVGVAAWIARMIRRRDPFNWAFPAIFLILMLPSAFAIAQPIENPSFTRMSGTLPLAFLLVALPLALMARSAARLLGGAGGVLVAGVAAGGLVFGSYVANQNTYFVDYNRTYVISSYPYSAAGPILRMFAENVGYGNAFVINRPAWWDHRALGIEGGVYDYPNGIPSLADVPTFLQSARLNARYPLDVNRDLLFFYAGDDVATHRWLLQKFPTGFWQLNETYQPEDTFYTFRVAGLGEAAFDAFIQDALDDDLSQQVG